MKTNFLRITIAIIIVVLLASCSANYSVGELHSEYHTVELGDGRAVNVEIDFGAGYLELTGGAQKLLEGDFSYNVASLRPELSYTGGDTVVVKQPDVNGMPNLLNVLDFRNEWGLRLSNRVPMDLKVDIGGGSGDLKLAGLSLTGLNVSLGAGKYTIDLTGDWARDLDVKINAGAGLVNVRLPREVGARVNVEAGPHVIETGGLTLNRDGYTNAAYGVSNVTMRVDVEAGIGQVNLEVE